jgi:hypothetical protein
MDRPGVEVVGVYPIDDAPEPCHLIELIIRASDAFNVGQITQEEAGVPQENWQVAWDAKILDVSGETVVADAWSLPEPDILPAAGETRLAFFFHHLDASKPLLTPLGPLHLPEASPLPSRLRAVEYEQP